MTNEYEFDQKLYKLVKELQKAGSSLKDKRHVQKEKQKIKNELYKLVGSRNQPSVIQ